MTYSPVAPSSSYVLGILYSCTVYGRTTSVDCATSTGASTAVAHAAAQRCQHRVRGSGPAPKAKPPEPDRCKSRTGPVPVVEFRYAVSLSRLNDRMVSPGCKYEDALGGAVHPTRLQAGLIVTWRMPSASWCCYASSCCMLGRASQGSQPQCRSRMAPPWRRQPRPGARAVRWRGHDQRSQVHANVP